MVFNMLHTFSQLEQSGVTLTYQLHEFAGRLFEWREGHADNWIIQSMGIYAFTTFICLSICNFKINFLY